jgi:hypothetical protein
VSELHLGESTGFAQELLIRRLNGKNATESKGETKEPISAINGQEHSDARRLRRAWLRIISNPATGQEEKCNSLPTSGTRIMMRARCQTRPARSPPILVNWQTLQFESRIDRHDAVDLAVWVLVILAGVDLLRVEEDGRDGHVEGCWRGWGDLCKVSEMIKGFK